MFVTGGDDAVELHVAGVRCAARSVNQFIEQILADVFVGICSDAFVRIEKIQNVHFIFFKQTKIVIFAE